MLMYRRSCSMWSVRVISVTTGAVGSGVTVRIAIRPLPVAAVGEPVDVVIQVAALIRLGVEDHAVARDKPPRRPLDQTDVHRLPQVRDREGGGIGRGDGRIDRNQRAISEANHPPAARPDAQRAAVRLRQRRRIQRPLTPVALTRCPALVALPQSTRTVTRTSA